MTEQELQQLIRQKAEQEQFELSFHAQIERGKDKIEIDSIKEALITAEIIEDYPEDPRGHSCLILGKSKKTPLHLVCGNFQEEKMLIITVYIPNPGKWLDLRYRKRGMENA